MQFSERFEQEGMQMLRHLEQVLLTGQMHTVIHQYQEISPDILKVQLALFRTKYSVQTSTDVVAVLQGMFPEVRGLFDQIETVARLLVVPVSSAEPERSFSSLRRLKTRLRSNMTQIRLNSVGVCHVHKDKLDRLNRKKIAEQFVSCKESRKSTFGSFK
uniref:HAT C-terminal dimerisation domain-containing protein n=1 Tax=Nothobranchius kuhntae TaxID=321403 RepID=A0A1A8JY72_NOTKU